MWSSYDGNGNPMQATPLGFPILSRAFKVSGDTTYTVPAGCRAILIECVGGGGGGGGVINAATNSGAGGGGGSGAYSATFKVTPKLTAFTIAIGALGTGASGAAGNAGGDTSFDTGPAICMAKGGAGGAVDTIATIHVGGAGGNGGAAASGLGDFKLDGRAGEAGMALAAAQAISGNGGASLFSGGANSVRNATSVGTAAAPYGGGGSGACAISGGAVQTGGAGSAGVIFITEYA